MTLSRQLEALGSNPDVVLDEIGAPLYLLDSEGIICWQNRAAIALTGDLSGVHVSKSVAREYSDWAERRLSERARGSATSEYTVVIYDAQRRRKRVRGTSIAFFDGERFAGLFGLVVSVEDDIWPVPRPELTRRQLDVLALLAVGCSTTEIASRLSIAIDTARNHIRRLIRSLDTHSRIEAVARARELGFL